MITNINIFTQGANMITNTFITTSMNAFNTKRHWSVVTVLTASIMAALTMSASSASYAQLIGVGNTTVNLTIPVSFTGVPTNVSTAFLDCTFQNSAVTTTGNGFSGGGPATVMPISVSSGQTVTNGVLRAPLTISTTRTTQIQQNVVINALFIGARPDIATCALTLKTGQQGPVNVYSKSDAKCTKPVTNTISPYMCVNETFGNANGAWVFSAGAFGLDPQIKISMDLTY